MKTDDLDFVVCGLGIGAMILLVVVLLAGCATTRPALEATDAQRDYCREVADQPTATWKKVAIWASNILVVPLTMPTILIGGPYFVYPDDAWGKKYDACMQSAGFH